MNVKWRHHWHAHHRLAISALVGIVAWALFPSHFNLMTRALFAGDVAGFVLVLLVGGIVMFQNVEDTQCQAAAHDPGRTLVWLIVIATSIFALFSATFVLHSATKLPDDERHLLSTLGVLTAALAWFLTHLAFSMRYAHLYYRGRPEDEGGLDFPGGNRPCAFDFAYFAFTLGMCFQTSDVCVTDPAIRRTVLGHTLLSFAYNTGILAIVLNVVVGQLV